MREFDSIESKLLHQIHKCDTLLRRGVFLNIVDMKKVRAGVSGIWEDIGFGGGQGRMLKVLSQHEDGISQKDLVELLDIRPSSVGELVTKLEQQGLVARTENEQDKRVVMVSLTDAGRERVKKITGMRDAGNEAVLSCLSAEEKDQLSTILEKLIYSIKEDIKEAREKEDCGRPRRRGKGFRSFGGPYCHDGHDCEKGGFDDSIGEEVVEEAAEEAVQKAE